MTKKLPCDECKGKCCTFVPFSPEEFSEITAKHPIPLPAKVERFGLAYLVSKGDQDCTCAYLKDGKCSIYEDRPLVCRQYGEVAQMPCKYLYPKKAEEEAVLLFAKIMAHRKEAMTRKRRAGGKG